ncbi:MAG: BamA/TamA family outer membrane protein [Ignavibacteriales bacterium]|nr:MAG: BamA/TamA family outer membrane protein [Ignavibacteriales bacterium]
MINFKPAVIKVDSIQILGNKITEPDIILREMTFRTGDTISYDQLKYNRERIYSLGIFTHVELSLTESDSINTLIISVEESWYIYPIPFVELEDKDWNKISYGVYLVVKNFRGMNESISSRAALGYDPSLNLSYTKPYLIREHEIYFSSIVSYVHAQNKSNTAELLYGGQFDQKFISASVTFGKRMMLFHRAGINLSFDYVETPGYVSMISASDDRIDHIISLGFNYNYDTRDLAQFPRNGIFASFDFKTKGLGLDGINYQVLNVDFREYRKLFDEVGAKWRFTSRITLGNNIPFYDRSFLGLGERIRGYYNNEQEGHEYYLGSVEINYPLIKELNINLDFIPVIPKQLLTYRIALFLGLFADTGTTRLHGEALSLKKLNSGYGTGLTLLVLPYNILRIEHAFDEYGNNQWVLDLGISF